MASGGFPPEPRWRIGFYPGPPQIRMEEEEEEAPDRAEPGRGRANLSNDAIDRGIEALTRERMLILERIDLANLSTNEKLKLLEENRLFMHTLRGGKTYKFATEKVIYGILTFSAVVIVILALLTSFANLPKEVTITFVGTVVGGTIATIAQKLGKVGSR